MSRAIRTVDRGVKAVTLFRELLSQMVQQDGVRDAKLVMTVGDLKVHLAVRFEAIEHPNGMKETLVRRRGR